MSDQMNFHVGDSDLRFLGLAAVLTARYEMKRKGGSVGHLPGFARSDSEAQALLHEGIALGTRIALDDVPHLKITVHGDKETVLRLLDKAK